MNYKEKIRNTRNKKGYSQEFMASQLNICQQAYCKLECGHTDITVERLFDIANILKVEAKSLL